MRVLRLAILLGLAGVCLQAQNNVLVAGGATSDGFSMVGRAGAVWGLETAFSRVARDVETSPNEWVRRLEIETIDAGASLRLRASRIAVYGGAGVSRETAVGSFQFLWPNPSAKFGGVERRLAPYASGMTTFRVWRDLHVIGRYTWRGNAAFAAQQTIAAGIAWEF